MRGVFGVYLLSLLPLSSVSAPMSPPPVGLSPTLFPGETCDSCDYPVSGLGGILLPNTSFILETGGIDEDGFILPFFRLIDTSPLYSNSNALWYTPQFMGETQVGKKRSSLIEGFQAPSWCVSGDEAWFVDLSDASALWVYALNLTSWSWSSPKIRGTPPRPRQLYTSACLNKTMLFHGGIATHPKSQSDTFWKLDLETLSWDTLPSAPFGSNLWNHKGAILQNKFILIGGNAMNDSHSGDPSVPIPNQEIWEFDLSSELWTNVTAEFKHAKTDQFEPYYGGGTLTPISNSTLIALGGPSSTALFPFNSQGWTVTRIDLSPSGTWTWSKPFGNTTQYQRIGHATVFDPIRNALVSFGGVSNGNVSYLTYMCHVSLLF